MGTINVKDSTGATVAIEKPLGPLVIAGTFTPSTSYALGQCIGGLITVPTGLGAGVKVNLQLVQLTMGAATFAAGAAVAIGLKVFEASPSGSTYTDANAAVLVAADAAKVVTAHTFTPVAGMTTSEPSVWTPSINMPRVTGTTDGSGNLYIAFIAGGTFTMTTPFAAWRVELRK